MLYSLEKLLFFVIAFLNYMIESLKTMKKFVWYNCSIKSKGEFLWTRHLSIITIIRSVW